MKWDINKTDPHCLDFSFDPTEIELIQSYRDRILRKQTKWNDLLCHPEKIILQNPKEIRDYLNGMKTALIELEHDLMVWNMLLNRKSLNQITIESLLSNIDTDKYSFYVNSFNIRTLIDTIRNQFVTQNLK